MRTPTDDELRRFIEKTSLELRARDAQEISRLAGVEFDGGRRQLCLGVLGRLFDVGYPGFDVHETAIDHHEGSLWLHSMILLYLRTADGWPQKDEWVNMRQLPGGLGYDRTFQNYSGDQLAGAFKNDLDGFRRVSRLFGGRAEAKGDAAFVFSALPRVPLLVVYSAGDEDFPAEAQVLFDSSAPHYLPTDALAILGGRLCKTLIQGMVVPSAARMLH